MRRTIALAILLLVALAYSPSLAAGGTIYSIPLPDLVGPDFLPFQGGREATFDFGQQFSEIERVSIEIEAHVYSREFDTCGTIFDPQPCTHVVQPVGFFSIMDDEDSPILGTIFSGSLQFDFKPPFLEGFGTDAAPFTNRRALKISTTVAVGIFCWTAKEACDCSGITHSLIATYSLWN